MVVSTNANKKRGCYETVVLIVADTPNGTLGLCINRPCPQVPCTCGKCSPLPVFLGGPEGIDDKWFLMHDQKYLAKKNEMLLPGIYLSRPHLSEDFSGIGKLLTGCFLWEPGQLQKEINKGWWLLDRKPDPKTVLKSEPKRLWHDMTPFHYSIKPSEN